MGKIEAPFTDEQVTKLKAWQQGHKFYRQPLNGIMRNIPTHPFTCCSHNGCERSQHYDGILIPRNEGWICPCGKYEQHWCHDFMVK